MLVFISSKHELDYEELKHNGIQHDTCKSDYSDGLIQLMEAVGSSNARYLPYSVYIIKSI
jgi:HD superfamily phosphohydrolase YqeK